MTKDEWLEFFESKTGCRELELYENERVFFHPDYGFLTCYVHDDVLELHYGCGDGKLWAKIVKEIMREKGLKKVRFFTKRNPKAWQRKYGARIRAYYMEADIDDIKD